MREPEPSGSNAAEGGGNREPRAPNRDRVMLCHDQSVVQIGDASDRDRVPCGVTEIDVAVQTRCGRYVSIVSPPIL